MITEITSAVFQVLVFSLIPFLIYFIKTKSTKGFLAYIGLKPSINKANFLAVLVCLIIALPMLLLTILNPEFKEVMTDPNSITGKIRAMGFGATAIVTIIAIAIFKTALAEEIFFRGFIAKRLISVTSFQTGNIIQAIIFGLIHSLIFLMITSNVFFLIVIFIFPALAAYCMVYLNEKLANGSIIPGWIAHALANVIAYSVVGFMI